jgi:hypothetical protein
MHIAERLIMHLIKLKTFLKGACRGGDDAAVLSRRDVLAGLGFAGAFVVAGSTLLAARPAEANAMTPAIEPGAAPTDAAQAQAAECDAPEGNLADLDTADFTEFSAQRRRYRRRYRRGYRRFRRRLRRRSRIVCRRRWIRGRLVRACRRVWY